jgi:hypothetical protein
MARHAGVSEQTISNYINAAKRGQSDEKEKVVTTTTSLDRLARVPLPTPVDGNTDIPGRMVASVKDWPATYPVPEAIKLYNLAVTFSKMLPALTQWLADNAEGVDYDANGLAFMVDDDVSGETEKEPAAADASQES